MGERPLHVVQFGSGNALYGAERWILALIRYLDPARVRTTVITVKDGPECPTALVDEARRRGFDTYLLHAPGRFDLKGVRLLADYCRGGGVDIVHSHGYKPDVYALLARRRGGYRMLATPHGWSHSPTMSERLYEGIDRAVFSLCDGVVPLSEDLRTSLPLFPHRNRIEKVILNGVDVREIEEAPPAPLPDGWGERDFVIGFVGQLIPRKGLGTLIDALAGLPMASWRCLIVGDGAGRSELVRLAEEAGLDGRVLFAGFRDDRLGLLKRFGAFVLPSRLEGIPRCLMEAMAAGVPVVASDIAGVRELVAHGDTGLLFPAGAAKALQGHLERLMADADLRKRLAERARDVVRERFSAQRMADEYHQVYDSLVAR